ncbi:MAG TPA: 3-deoxy-7-phosphoheptulonate synthase [Polyangiaceae bacterium]|jgi:3-deoxy-7-phosphoheptulonate synthase|nr:3-deoxy-7-phosphoheptulonate synthase [Polyangiaceae bacterium]
MKATTDDLRIKALRPLLPPAILMEELPLSERDASFVSESRRTIGEVVVGRDPRLLVVVGPCSIHDPSAAVDYAGRLREVSDRLNEQLLIVMRTYFEKPRTTVGWKGLINDPDLDGSFAINRGLRVARQLLLDVVRVGLPTGTEFLDPISPQFVADLVCWGAIGARTSESQVHRELASGLSMPVGFKNGTGGAVGIAVDAIAASSHPHEFLSVTKQGVAAIVSTSGNDQTHLILRGGGGKTNYDSVSVADAVSALGKARVNPRVMIDCSHANSEKNPARQAVVAGVIAQQVAAGDRNIMGVMLESFILGGNQPLRPRAELSYGQSITDGCLSWLDTVPVLERLAQANADRRLSAP